MKTVVRRYTGKKNLVGIVSKDIDYADKQRNGCRLSMSGFLSMKVTPKRMLKNALNASNRTRNAGLSPTAASMLTMKLTTNCGGTAA